MRCRPRLLVALRDQPFDLLRGIGEKTSRVEPEIQPIVEQRRITAIGGRRSGPGKAKRRHGVEVDPFCSAFKTSQKIPDDDFSDERLTLCELPL